MIKRYKWSKHKTNYLWRQYKIVEGVEGILVNCPKVFYTFGQKDILGIDNDGNVMIQKHNCHSSLKETADLYFQLSKEPSCIFYKHLYDNVALICFTQPEEIVSDFCEGRYIKAFPEEKCIQIVKSFRKNKYPDNGRHTDGYWYVKI